MILSLLAAAALAHPAPIGLDDPPPLPQPQRGVAAGTARFEDGSEPIEIKTEDNAVLHGGFYAPKLPKGGGQRAPGAILVHGAGGSRAQVSELAKRLQKEGLAVLAIDLRGHGDSATAGLRWGELQPDALDRTWALAARDVDAAAKWLAARGDVHAANLNLVGLRGGSALVVREAKRNENVRSVVLIDPEPKILGFDVARDLAALQGLPTQIVLSQKGQEIGRALLTEAQIPAEGGSVQLALARTRSEDLLDDKKVVSDIVRWLTEQALPKRGSAPPR